MQTVTQTVLINARETINSTINLAPPAPANTAKISPLMAAVIRNMKLAELVENYDPA